MKSLKRLLLVLPLVVLLFLPVPVGGDQYGGTYPIDPLCTFWGYRHRECSFGKNMYRVMCGLCQWHQYHWSLHVDYQNKADAHWSDFVDHVLDDCLLDCDVVYGYDPDCTEGTLIHIAYDDDQDLADSHEESHDTKHSQYDDAYVTMSNHWYSCTSSPPCDTMTPLDTFLCGLTNCTWCDK